MTTIVGPGKEVSEKSLELNICAELLQHIRAWPGCQRALWLGLTQAQERRRGLDELIRNVGQGVALMFQFKAPRSNSRVDYHYTFSVNERQHEALDRLAIQYPDAVYYVFPLYTAWEKADRHAPDLSQDTWLVPVSSMLFAWLTSLSSPSTGLHRVVLERFQTQMTVTAHSPEVVGEAINARDYFTGSDRGQSTDAGPVGVTSSDLREWLDSLGQQINKAPRFRGLNAIFIPSS